MTIQPIQTTPTSSKMTNISDEQQQQQQQQQFLMAAAAMAAANCHNNNNNSVLLTGAAHFTDDVRKWGYMRKLKTNKRKFFVLRLNSLLTLSKATIAYYDNEKKYRDKCPARRTIVLVECFAVARIPDQKRYVLGIYTKDDLLAAICDDEKQLNEWLQAIRSILYRTPEYHCRSLRDFHFIWQGHINRVDGALPRALMGTYRFCLMPTVLYLIRLESSNSNSNNSVANSSQANRYEFPLSIIHRCGHKDKTFYLKIGRLSELGAGECWVQTDDQTIAEHMHAKVSSFWALNKNSKSADDGGNSNNTTTAAGDDHGKTTATMLNNHSSSTASSLAGYRPRSSSTSNAINSNQLSGSSSRQPHHLMMHQFMPTAAVQFHPGLNQHHHHHTANNRNSMPATSSSTSSQSPADSRERLQSCSSSTGGGGGGSVRSHTASDCSNEDLSQGYCASSNSASSAATTPLGPMFPSPWNIHHLYHHGMPHHFSQPPPTSHHNHSHQCSSSQSSFYLNNSFAQSSSSCGGSLHNPSNPITKNPTNSSTSSLSTEFDIQEQQQLQQIHATMFSPLNCLDLNQNQHSNLVMGALSQDNDKGFGADLDLYPAYIPPLSSQSTSSTTMPACASCIQMCYLQLFQQQQQQHLSSTTSGQPTHQSPITSPKCHCSACLMHSFTHESSSSISSSLSSSNTNCTNNGGQSGVQNHHYLPTIPAGEPSDYVPMKPMNAHSPNNNSSADDQIRDDDISKKKLDKTDEEEENCYLHMSPLAVANGDGSNPMVTSTSNSVSNSIEFNLEKLRSYIRDDDHTVSTTAKTVPVTIPANMNESNDDTIFNGLTRAYSTGSKPQPLAPSIGSQCNNQPVTTKTNIGTDKVTKQQQLPTPSSSSSKSTTTSHQIRNRASSTGSHGMKFSAFLSSRRKNKMSAIIPIQQQQQMTNPQVHNDFQHNCQWPSSMETASSSCCSLIEEQSTNKSNKAASAPILSSLIQPRVRSLTLGSKPAGLRLHNLFKNKSTSVTATSSVNQINPLLQCTSQIPPDILANLYGHSLIPKPHASCTCSLHHHHHHHNHFAHHHHHMTTAAPTTSQPVPHLNNHPMPVSFLPEEGDLMEIDYSANNKSKDHRFHQKHHHHHHGHHHHHHHAKSIANNQKTNDSSNETIQSELDTDEKNIDITSESRTKSATSDLSNRNRKNSDSSQSNSEIVNNSHKSSMNEVQTQKSNQNTLDHLVHTLKHTLSIHGSKQPHSINTSPSFYDDNDDYIMFTPGSQKNNHSNVLSKSLPEQDIINTKINRNLTTYSDQSIAPLATNEILSDDDQKPVHLAEEEESLYVLLSPDQSSSSNKASTTLNSGNKKSNSKKTKSSTMRSLFSSITMNTGVEGNQGSGSRFRFMRSISSCNNNNHDNNSIKSTGKNSSRNQRQSSSRSESSPLDHHIHETPQTTVIATTTKSSPSPTNISATPPPPTATIIT
nr:probable serine/threonine-protein kinase DDB_G0282963 [Dermatophagoides farinae]XP_046914543.1 probable serine/threonine-protein kinase DDB_G0282963 [Dermatophagoides farinae]